MVKKSIKPKTGLKTQNDTTVAADIDAAIVAVQAAEAAVSLPKSNHITHEFRIIYKKLRKMKGDLHKWKLA